MRTLIVLTLTALMSLPALAETPSDPPAKPTLAAQALDLLRRSQADPARLVAAIQALSRAVEQAEKDKDEALATDLNACLYWAKKRLTLDGANALAKADPNAAKRAEAVAALPVRPEDAKGWLERADGYAEGARDPMLAAIRYFEVAQRFVGTPESLEAQQKSLDWMQRAGIPRLPTGQPRLGDGKLFVQSIPPGAMILLEQDGELRDTGKVTPALVNPPKGKAVVVLRKDGYADAIVETEVADGINKPAPAKLEALAGALPAKAVALTGDGKLLLQSDPPGAIILVERDGQAVDTACRTPFLVRVPRGMVTFILRKTGFEDLRGSVEVGEGICKPDPIRLHRPLVDVDVLFAEPGWAVFVDGQRAKDKNGKEAEAPCTVRVEAGRRELTLAKDGFRDVAARIIIEEGKGQVEVKGRATIGKSMMLLLNMDWHKINSNQWKDLPGNEFIVQADKPTKAPGIAIKPGEIWVVVSCPEDKWKLGKSGELALPVSSEGNGLYFENTPMPSSPQGSIVFKVNNTWFRAGMVFSGNGEISLCPNDNNLTDNSGTIRIKVIKIK